MTEHLLVKTFYSDFAQYICPNCGNIIESYKPTVDIFIENDIPHFCEGCDEPIKFK